MTKHLPVLSALFLVATALPAQEAPPRKQEAPQPVISIDFGGGSLRDLVDAMRRTDPRLNITASALARDVKLPDLAVKGASVINVLNAAAIIAPAEFGVVCRMAENSGEPVYTVAVERRHQPNPPKPVERGVHVFSLATLTEPMAMDRKDKPIALATSSVLSALEVGVGMLGEQAAVLKYHGESKLLFVEGTGEQLDVVREVLQNLQKDQIEQRQAQVQERHRAEEEAARAKADARPSEGKVDKK
jgi:hypothetical protein